MSDAPQPQAQPQSKGPAEHLREVQERMAPHLEEAEARLAEAGAQAKAFIRRNPGTALLGAAALGFLVGRWASRK